MHVHNPNPNPVAEGRSKRRRMDDDLGGATSQGVNAEGTAYLGAVQRDAVYWDDDPKANLYVRVHGHMFKIHPILFDCSPDLKSNVEAKMRQNGLIGGEARLTEERPYHLMNCTIGQFRAFLWIAASGAVGDAESLSAFPQTHDCIEKLMRISDFLAIYSAEKLQQWVESKYKDMASGRHPFLDSCSSESLTLLLSIGCNGRDEFKDAVVKKWIRRLWEGSAATYPAIDAAEQHKIDSLRGVAYYISAQDMIGNGQASTTPDGPVTLRADNKLNGEQKTRVYRGSCSLVASWERFRKTPLALEMADGCTAEQHAKCTSVWTRRWNSAIGWSRIMSINSTDLLKLHDCLRDQLANDDDLKSALHPACRLRGLEAMRTIRAAVLENLAEHFSLT